MPQAKQDRSKDGGFQIFKRLSIRERGHFSNHFTLVPVKEIGISEHAIYLKVGSKRFQYGWADIKQATLRRSIGWKSYGMYVGTEHQICLFILRSRDRVFKFDVSSQFPDFERADELLATLRKHFNIVEEKVVPVWKKHRLLIFLGLLGVAFSAKVGWLPTWALLLLLFAILLWSSLEVSEIRESRRRSK